MQAVFVVNFINAIAGIDRGALVQFLALPVDKCVTTLAVIVDK